MNARRPKSDLTRAIESRKLSFVINALRKRPSVINSRCISTAVYKSGRQGRRIIDALFNYGFSIHAKDLSDPTFFYLAVEKNYVKVIQKLLKRGIRPDSVGKPTHRRQLVADTILCTAAYTNRLEIVKLMLNYGTDVNAKDSAGRTPLYYAVVKAHVKLTELLLANNAKTDEAFILHGAVSSNCLQIVEIIAKHGVNVNGRDENGQTALHFNTNSTGDLKNKISIAQLLLSMGADVNARDNRGLTPLHIGVTRIGHTEHLQLLLQHNANINVLTCEQETPLHIAIRNNNKDACRLILKHAAAYFTTTDGRMKLINAIARLFSEDYPEDALSEATCEASAMVNGVVPELILLFCCDRNLESDKLVSSEVLEKLVKSGMVIDDNNITALGLAVTYGSSDAVTALLKHGANVNLGNCKGKTPLHIAAQYGRSKIASQLIRCGANVNLSDVKKRTPLHIAAAHGYDVAYILLRNNADVNLVCNEKQTALASAMRSINQVDSERDGARGHENFGKEICKDLKGVVYILIRHIAKMMSKKLHVSDLNLGEIVKNDWLNNYYTCCRVELSKMVKGDIMNTGISFADILFKHPNIVAKYLCNDDVSGALMSEKWKKRYPCYCIELKYQMREALLRRNFVEKAEDVISLLFPGLSVVTENIISYLKNGDIIF